MVSPASIRANSPEGIKTLKACKHNLCCFQPSKKVRAAQSAISWKWGVLVERFHALLTKPITATLYDPRDISRSSHHDSVFSFSPRLIYTFTVRSFICSGYAHLYTISSPLYVFRACFVLRERHLPQSLHLSNSPRMPGSSSSRSWYCSYLPHPSYLSSATSLAADLQIILGVGCALIRDKTLFSLQACDWPWLREGWDISLATASETYSHLFWVQRGLANVRFAGISEGKYGSRGSL